MELMKMKIKEDVKKLRQLAITEERKRNAKWSEKYVVFYSGDAWMWKGRFYIYVGKQPVISTNTAVILHFVSLKSLHSNTKL